VYSDRKNSKSRPHIDYAYSSKQCGSLQYSIVENNTVQLLFTKA